MTAPTLSALPDAPRSRWRRPAFTFGLLALSAAVAWALLLLWNTRADATPPFSGQVVGNTLFVRGSSADDLIVVRLRSGVPTTLDVDFGNDGTADLSFDRGTFTAIQVEALGGADNVRIDETNGMFTDTEATTLDGGGGNDSLVGGNNTETLIGNGGNDFAAPGRGNDLVLLGGGNDTSIWNPGDGSDVIEGQTGKDVLSFNGANINEHIDISANGERVRFFRDIAAITMDLADVETIQFKALGGADVVNVNDLTGTSVRDVDVNLSGFSGPDGQPDQVIVNGTTVADEVEVVNEAPAAVVKGLTAKTFVTGGEPALDQLIVDTSDGDDSLEASPNVGALIHAVLEGSGGTDTAFTEGTSGNDVFTVVANGAFATVTDGGTGFFSVVATDTLRVIGKGGDDSITGGNGLAALLPALVIDGGGGRDTLGGGDGGDFMLGGGGNDVVDGNRGNDLVLLGGGADTAVWDPGDGSDTIEGEAGKDTLRFNGANINENIDVSANGGRVRLFRDIAAITMDLNEVETLQVNALGGADTVTVNDLAGTTARAVNVNLLATGGTGDGQPDRLVVNGTSVADFLNVVPEGPAAVVDGLAVVPSVTGGEPTLDQLVVNGLGGMDSIQATPAVGALINAVLDGGADLDAAFTEGTSGNDVFTVVANGALAVVTDGGSGFFSIANAESVRINGNAGEDSITAGNGLASLLPLLGLDGGGGNDIIAGGDGGDVLVGGGGNDLVDGNRGNDVAYLGGGTDVFSWDPGDGSDVVEGEGGLDTLNFNGANINEHIDISANGERVRLFRDIAAITMDLNDVETLQVNALGGADNVTVNALNGTDARTVNVNLQASGGGGDFQADQVTVNGTANVDKINVAGTGTSATVTGLVPAVQITGAEYANDRLNLDTLDGADIVNFGGLAPNVIQLWVDNIFVF